MAKFEYEVLVGIDYPPNNRAEAGDIVSDLPKDSIAWLLDSDIIKIAGNKKAPASKVGAKNVDEAIQAEAIYEENAVVEIEVDDEL